jgi:biopolymer transport protein ExbD/biopolymer transport protein TolR
MKKFKAPPPVADINVTPMVDVMLVMLIIFMVITPMLSHGFSVDLFKARNPVNMANEEKEDAIVVAVTREGRTFLGTTPTSPEDLPAKVKDLLVNRTDRTTYVKADARAKYSKVVEVVDNLRNAGVDQLGLVTDKVDEKGH